MDVPNNLPSILDDSNSDLDELHITWPTSVVDSLIRAQGCIESRSRDFSSFDSLLCLSISSDDTSTYQEDELSLVQLPKHERGFAVISYVWNAPDHEEKLSSPYKIRLASGKTRPSNVRCTVLRRIVKYITSLGLSFFWIDQECIDQQDSQAKSDAINAMDILYRRSYYPLGILSVPLTLERHVNHVQQLLAGDFVEETSDGPRPLYLRASFCKAHRVLRTLYRILCDPWWTRRWTFQEEYCTSQSMQLLVPVQIAGWRSDAKDLIVDSRNFRRHVTLFCVACQEIDVFRSPRTRRYCRFVLDRVRSYGILREYGQLADNIERNCNMSTLIWTDLCRRSTTVQSDTLAMMANCCGYPVRLSAEDLKAANILSLSVGMLALFILNGEILRHGSRHRAGTVLDLVKTNAFRGRGLPPVDHELTFLKRCRFSNVKLRKAGISTTGYLWHCIRTLRLGKLNSAASRNDVIDHIITNLTGKNIGKLQTCLRGFREGCLPQFLTTPGLQEIFESMIQSVIQAVVDEQLLLLAKSSNGDDISAIFVLQQNLTIGSNVFTSCKGADNPASKDRYRFLDHFVSLRVDHVEHVKSATTYIQVHEWVNGIWFPQTHDIQEVMFPWPLPLRGLRT